MAHPDPGPLLDEHLDELEGFCRIGESNAAVDMAALWQFVGWHDRHDRQLLEAARWALAHGWRRGLA